MAESRPSDYDADHSYALWTVAPARLDIRTETVPPPGPGEVRVRTLASGVSRGTESLVFQGLVPESEWQRMRAPFQVGDFPFPVKYGYACVGRIEAPAALASAQPVFVLHPHQSLFNVPLSATVPVPETVPPARAVLAANMETALNGLWDGLPSPGDHIAVVGGGVVGLLVAALAAKIPATTVTLVDVNPARAALAEHFGLAFALPDAAPGDQDLVIHTSGAEAGLDTALSLAGMEATVLEMSWYGDRIVSAALGRAFHSQRLTLKSSQVGSIPPTHRPRWTHRRRIKTALALLADPRFDRLLESPIAFSDAATVLPEILSGRRDALAQVLVYQ